MTLNLNIERRLPADLVPYEANSKRHGDEDIGFLKRSITKFGFNDPIAVTPDGVIIEGHGRWLAAKELGLDDVPVLVIEGMTEDQYDLYRIAHNKIALTSTFNFPALFDCLQELVGADNGLVFGDMGFGDRMVNSMFEHFGDNEPTEDGVPVAHGKSVADNSAAIEYDVLWDDKEMKARFNNFLNAQAQAGADKSMGGDILLAAIAKADPDLWAEIVNAVPGEMDLDHIAGSTEAETVHVTH